MAVWPPSGEPMAHGLPTSPGSATSVLLRPLRCGACRSGGSAAGTRTSKPMSARRRPLGAHAPEAAVGAGEQLVPGAEAGPGPVDPQAGRRRLAAVPGRLHPAGGVGHRVVEAGGEAHARPSRSSRRRPSAAAPGARRRRDPRRRRGEVRPAGARPPRARRSRPGPASARRGTSRRQVREAVGPGHDHQLVAPDLGRVDQRADPAVVPGRRRRRRPAAARPDGARQCTAAAQEVVAVLDQRRPTTGTASPTVALAGMAARWACVGRSTSMTIGLSTPSGWPIRRRRKPRGADPPERPAQRSGQPGAQRPCRATGRR